MKKAPGLDFTVNEIIVKISYNTRDEVAVQIYDKSRYANGVQRRRDNFFADAALATAKALSTKDFTAQEKRAIVNRLRKESERKSYT